MRIIFSNVPVTTERGVLPTTLHMIRQPSYRLSMTMAILLGFILAFSPFVLKSMLVSALEPYALDSQFGELKFPMWHVPLIFIFCIIAHEFLHLICHPENGTSDNSIFVLWFKKMQVGVQYRGFMSKKRWIIMRLLPLIGLSLIPTIILFLSGFLFYDFYFETVITIIILINGLGSGADLIAAYIVAKQVPPNSKVGIWGGKACWEN